MAESGSIETVKQFKNSPADLARRWGMEISAAKKNVERWRKSAHSANKRYLGEGDGNDNPNSNRSRVNLFHANVNIVLSVLFGQLPKVNVTRRFGDQNDDVGRVAGEALERHLNTDIEDDDDDFSSELKDALKDWKIGGLGQIRLRYDFETEQTEGTPAKLGEDGQELAPEVPPIEQKAEERIDTEYVYWEDFLWSPCRRWKECRWVAFRAEMTRDEAVKRFGKVAQTLPIQSRSLTRDDGRPDPVKDAWSRISVWEIWSKDSETVYWYVEGFDRIVDQKPDPLGLDGFFPCPKPLVANLTTGKFIPKPDLDLDRAHYDEIDEISTRLRRLVKTARVVGAHDSSQPALARIFEEADEGKLVPVQNWAGFAEKGGLAGAVQLVPIDGIVKAIEILTAKMSDKVSLLYQTTGLSDVVRGQASAKATATEQKIKAGFASTRLQTDQDETARFATDLQRLRAEIISKHFDPESIVEGSNLRRVEIDPQTKQPNEELIQQAVALIKSDVWQYRIEVKPDSISLRDYAALKQERVETIGALGALFQQGITMAQMFPPAAPFLLELGKWLIAATKGSQQIEGIFDKFADVVEKAASQPPPPPQPDPKLQAAQVKAQAEMGKAQATMQQTTMDAQHAQAQHQMDMQKLSAEVLANQQKAQTQIAVAQAQPRPAIPGLPGEMA